MADAEAGNTSFLFKPSLCSLDSPTVEVGTGHLSLAVTATWLPLVTVFVVFLLQINGKELGVTDKDDGVTHNEMGSAGDEQGTSTDEEHGRMDAGGGTPDEDDGRVDDEQVSADEELGSGWDEGLDRSDASTSSSASFFSLSALLASLLSARRMSRLATC